MAGTFALDQLVQIAAHHGAMVRLLGDDRQLSAVESGGALRLIAARRGGSGADDALPVQRPGRSRRHTQAPDGDASGSIITSPAAASGQVHGKRWPRPPTRAGAPTCWPAKPL